MKKKLFNISIIILCILIFLALLIEKKLIYNSILYALNLWVKNLIPALFPFFIITDILINYNITLYIPKSIKEICKYIFNITDNMFTIFILSILSGFPSNAKNTRALYKKGLISLNEANHILMFSHFSNPIFILTTVGLFFFKSKKIGIVILVSHYISNIILGILIRNNFNHSLIKYPKYKEPINLGNIFINAIKGGIDTILLICGILVVFLMLSAIIINLFNFNIYNSMLIKGIFEITIGIEALSKLNINSIYKTVITSCFLSFGGLSVHMQVLSQITDTNIKYHYYFIGRLLQMIISGILAYILCIIFNI